MATTDMKFGWIECYLEYGYVCFLLFYVSALVGVWMYQLFCDCAAFKTRLTLLRYVHKMGCYCLVK